jgi:hypothetical protein
MARTQAAFSDPLALLRGALQAPHDRVRLASVRNEREAINAALRQSDAEVPELTNEELDPEWTAIVIAALESHKPSPLASLLVELRIADEHEEGRRFAELVQRLPESLAYFKAFEGLPISPFEVQQRIILTPAALAAGDIAVRLAKYGLSPLTFIAASQVMANVLLNACRDRSGDYVPRPRNAYDERPANRLLEEIALSCDIDTDVAKAILAWLMNAGRYESDVIPGFVVGKDLRVRPVRPLAAEEDRGIINLDMSVSDIDKILDENDADSDDLLYER